jgi:hypothetical protein
VRRSTAIALAVVVASFALVAAGCGGSSESTPLSADDWATQFCTDLSTWKDSIQTTTDELKNPSSLNEESLNSAVDSVTSATQTFVDDVKDLGAPDTQSGDQVKSSLQSLSDTLDTEKSNIQDAADNASGLTGLASAVTAIGQSLSAMGTALTSTLNSIQSADVGGELETALKNSDACSSLTS